MQVPGVKSAWDHKQLYASRKHGFYGHLKLKSRVHGCSAWGGRLVWRRAGAFRAHSAVPHWYVSGSSICRNISRLVGRGYKSNLGMWLMTSLYFLNRRLECSAFHWRLVCSPHRPGHGMGRNHHRVVVSSSSRHLQNFHQNGNLVDGK